MNQVKQRTIRLKTLCDKLAEAELRYRTVADFAYDWEYWIDTTEQMKYVSPSCERISGYPPAMFEKHPGLLSDIVLPEDRNIWNAHLSERKQELGPKEVQFRIRHKDNSIRWIEHFCQPIIDDLKNLMGFRACNRDITQRKENESRLENAYTEIKVLKQRLERYQTYLREEIKRNYNDDNLIGESDVMQYVKMRARQIACTETPVLIQGETGTGKELIARAIHNASNRGRQSLIKVDCASLPANLIESELFGHEKGAFTNADKKRVGRFELASGSTMFLDGVKLNI